MSRRFTLLWIGMLGITTVNAQSPMQKMKKYEGDWSAVITMWMGAGEASMKDSVKVHYAMMMNDLFLTARYSGTVMSTPYEGLQTIGYDLQKNVYVNSFIDNMNSGIQYSEGKMSADGKSIELHGTTFDGNSNKEVPLREVLTFADNTHQRIEFFMTANTTETKTMEIDLVKEE